MPGINFSEESINQMYQLYSSMLGEVSAEAETFSRTVAEKARETQYLKMVELAARVLEYCSTDLKQNAMKAFETWQESAASLQALMRNYQAGEEAVNTARAAEERIRGQLEGWNVGAGEDLGGIDTSHPQYEPGKDDDAVTEAAMRYRDALDRIMESYSAKAQDEQEENMIFMCIGAAVNSTMMAVLSGIGGVQSAVQEFQAKTSEMEASAKSKTEEGGQNAARQASSLSQDGVSELLSKVRGIWH